MFINEVNNFKRQNNNNNSYEIKKKTIANKHRTVMAELTAERRI